MRCACRCHEGQTLEVSELADAVERVQTGKKNSRLLDEWGARLRAEGELRVRAPEDPKVLASARQRLYTAAKRQALRVSVRVCNGQLVATCK